MTILKLEGETAVERGIWLKEILKGGTYEVTFKKVNDEIRCMPCTLAESIIPLAPEKEKTQTKKHNPEVMSVWCVDKNEWRSFRVMNILKVAKAQHVTTWTVALEEDPATGDLIMPLPPGLMETQGWDIGDVLEWDVDAETGTVSLTKKI